MPGYRRRARKDNEDTGKGTKSNDLSIFTMIPEKLIFIPIAAWEE